MKRELYETILDNPVIVGVKNDDELEKCIALSEERVVFVLYGNICNIAEIVRRLKAGGKTVFVHADLISGLSAREIAVDFIKAQTFADGIISTKPVMIKRAAELGLSTALRIFLIDSMAVNNIEKQIKAAPPDIVEILPGIMPKIIRRIKKDIKQPIIASGLISDREDIITALDAGALAVSSTNPDIWEM